MSNAALSWLIGFLISCVLALVSYFIEVHRSGDEKKRLALNNALNMGLLGAVLTAVIAFNFESRDAFSQSIPRVQSRTWQVIVGDIALLDQEMSENQGYGRIQELTLEPIRQTLSRSIAEAKQGVVVTRSVAQTINLASDLMGEARQRILVTSYISPEEWWTTQAGSEYSQLTREVPGRVQSFQRIFIVDDERELKLLLPLMKRQREQGIQVRYVYSSKLEPDLRRDFLVIDELLAAEIVLNEGRRFREGRFYTTKVLTQDFAERFRQISVWAEEPGSVQGSSGP